MPPDRPRAIESRFLTGFYGMLAPDGKLTFCNAGHNAPLLVSASGIRRRTAELCIYVPTAIALYVLNQKREALTQIELRYGFRVAVSRDDSLIPPAFRLERLRALTPAEAAILPAAFTQLPPPIEDDDDDDIEETEDSAEQSSAPAQPSESGGEEEVEAEHGGSSSFEFSHQSACSLVSPVRIRTTWAIG